MHFCPNCGAPVVSGSNFCQKCGANLKQEAAKLAALKQGAPVADMGKKRGCYNC
ncbi:zinc-ribbon domain-containing protein [Secundilactobacillus collinoides]|uniref:zinc-ribbon domain-containing protein n=1 Tax=Secundilactobacillus collinoides TaxID=33960 RepID=UPI000B2F79CB